MSGEIFRIIFFIVQILDQRDLLGKTRKKGENDADTPWIYILGWLKFLGIYVLNVTT